MLDAVLADPDDDATRLVYADWLLEQGDPRGEFIQVECEVARIEHLPLENGEWAQIDRHRALRARAKRLLVTHQKAWLLPFRPHLRQWRFARGFPDWVATTAQRFAAGGAQIAEHTPIRILHVEGFRAQRDITAFAEALARSPALIGLRKVTLSSLPVRTYFGDASRVSIALTESLRFVQSLDVAMEGCETYLTDNPGRAQ